MLLDISPRLKPQMTTIIYHHIKKILLKERKYKNMGIIPKTHMLTKTIRS